MKKNKIWIWIVVIIIIVIIARTKYHSLLKNRAFEECKKKAERVCDDYGVNEADIDFSYSQKYKEYDVYKLYVNGNSTEISNADIYELVKEIDSLYIDFDKTLLLNDVTLNGKKYKLDVLDKNKLECDDQTVFVYVSDQVKSDREWWSTRLPSVGMREEYLEYTALGKADSIEKCADFAQKVARARSKTYKWEATTEHGWYSVTVYYRKHRSHRVDDYEDLPSNNGYVESITYTGENGQLKTEYYRDTY